MMHRRSMTNSSAQATDPTGSYREKIELKSRAPIKRKRNVVSDAVSDCGPGSESPEPPKKSPKDTMSDYGPGSDRPKKSPKDRKSSSYEGPPMMMMTTSDYGLGSEASDRPKKSTKGGASAGRYLHKEPDGPAVAAAENQESGPSPEPEKMDCSDDTDRERVSSDENQPEKNKDFTAPPQNPEDEDMNSDTELEADSFPDPSGPSANQTFSADNTQRLPNRQTKPLFSATAQADISQPFNYREPQKATIQSTRVSRQRVLDYGLKQATHKADFHQLSSYRKPQNYIDPKQSTQIMRPSVPDYGIKQATHKGSRSFLWKLAVLIVGLIAVVCACIFYLWSPEASVHLTPKEREMLLLGKWKEILSRFPNQRQELWARSNVMLKKHVGAARHTQPVILMLAAAPDAEVTMRCLARGIAAAYASAFNSTVVEIDGSGKASLNSDEVKLDLDDRLSSGFSEGSKAAVVHHFQDLPPLSTLLFYKYCDHENAAFKDVSLLITVLLDEAPSMVDAPLPVVEETVYDFLRKTFCTDKPGALNDMNTDKLSGLWSRISHLVLPVRPETEIEAGGCPV
uniref:torsin-1A-interacting protein 2-like isoform X2 n=1 Tax=Pristiophorus japonicus TaxID=55135 RepID=UPI00398E5F41